MRVEFLGLPGVGKTTLRKDLLERLSNGGGVKYLSSDEAFLQVARKYADNVFRKPLNILPHFLARKFADKLQNRTLMQFEAQNRFLASSGKALEAFLRSDAFSNMSLNDRRLVIGSFLETGSLVTCIEGHLERESMVFFEEGLVQKSIMFVDHANDSSIDKDNVYAYLENIPLPDLVVYITADLETCKHRMISRPDGLTQRLKTADDEKIGRFLTYSHNHLECVADWLKSHCNERFVEINNQHGFADGSAALIARIQAAAGKL